jgi:spore germination cell wall hydrolase CwlJ-like protein
MKASRKRPKGACRRLFGLVFCGSVLMPTGVGYQDLAALIARQPAVTERWRQHVRTSTFGTIHAATFSFPRPMGSAIPDPYFTQLASLDPRALDVTGSVPLHTPVEPAVAARKYDFPVVERRLKGDKLTAPKPLERAPAKGDRATPAIPSVPPAAAAPAAAPEPAMAAASEPKRKIEAAPEPKRETAALPEPEREAFAVPEPEREAAAAPEPEPEVEAAPQPKQDIATAPVPQPELEVPASEPEREVEGPPVVAETATAGEPDAPRADIKSAAATPAAPEAAPEAAPQPAVETPVVPVAAAPLPRRESAGTVEMLEQLTSPRQTSKVFFGTHEIGFGGGGLQPWEPDEVPTVLAAPHVDPEIKRAALDPLPDANPEAETPGETVAAKGEVTGEGKRPRTPAERLNLSGASRVRHEKCLANAVYFEARGEVERGQMAVAQVVLNRAFSGYYPGNVCDVVYQNAHRHLACQFTFACDNVKDVVREPEAWETATRIARDALDGKFWLPEVGKATHYHATYVNPWWVRTMTKHARLGIHIFYRPKRWGPGEEIPVWGDRLDITGSTKKPEGEKAEDKRAEDKRAEDKRAQATSTPPIRSIFDPVPGEERPGG